MNYREDQSQYFKSKLQILLVIILALLFIIVTWLWMKLYFGISVLWNM